MDRFSEAYDKAKSVVKSSAFAGDVEKLRGKLKQLMGDDGPSSGETATLDKLRETIEVAQSTEFINGKNTTKAKAHADTIIKASADAVGRANRAATLKMLYHLYHGKTTGSSVVWVYSPPKIYSKWIYDEVSSDGEDAIRTALMKDGTEVYSQDERKMMCDAVQTARKVVMDAAAKLATPDTATKARPTSEAKPTGRSESTEAVAKERAEVPEPAPVSHQGIRYEAVPWGKARGWGQNGGYVAAVDERTGEEKWTVKVYDVSYDRDIEQDKLDIFITKLTLRPADHALHVENERGAAYLVDLETRKVTGPLPQPES